jgi:ATP-dependent RNA helicase DDX52/ROK1
VECIRQGIDLSRVRLVVLDEADRLLDVADGGGTKHTNNEKNTDQTNDLKDGSISEDSESSDDSPSSKEEETPQNSKNQADPIQQQQSGSRQTQTFLAQIDAILSHIPTSAIRGLFSATITPPVRSLSESMLRNPVDITIGGGSSGPSANTDIDQKLMFVGREEGKLLAIRQITQKGIKPPVIICLESKDRAQALCGELMYDGIRVDVIHAGRLQSAWLSTMISLTPMCIGSDVLVVRRGHYILHRI